jgi:sensor histidine kinase YesM
MAGSMHILLRNGPRSRHPPSLGFPLGDSWLGIAALCLLLEFAAASSTITELAGLTNLASTIFVRFVGSFVSVGGVLVAGRHLPEPRALRWSSLALVTLLAASLGACASDAVELALGSRVEWFLSAQDVYAMLTLPALVAALSEFQRLRESARTAMDEERLRATALQGQIVEARLQLLQAQIEPHFLFNSLANVRRLSRLDAPAGATLLSDLLRYLEAALPQMRSGACTVAKEVELARAFLAVHQVRMGARLAFAIDVESDLSNALLPPMMLLTLLENSLKHGIGPLPEGGRIAIRIARDADKRVRLTVADTGQGLRSAFGHGVGLANIRSRLRSLYGDAGSLALSLNEPTGTIATIVWPEHRA